MSGPAERGVGEVVLGHGDELQQLPLRRDHVDAALRIQRLGRAAGAMHAGRGIQVALRVDAHPVRAPARIEVVEHPHVLHRAIGQQIVGADHPRPALGAVGFDEVERLIVRRDLDAVGPLDVWRGENSRDLPRRVDAIDGCRLSNP